MDIKMKKRFEYKNLPDMQTIRSEIDKIAKNVTIGETLFMRENGVKSEAEYKKKMAAKGHIMKHTHIGWNSWDVTAKGTEYIYNELKKRGSYVVSVTVLTGLWVFRKTYVTFFLLEQVLHLKIQKNGRKLDRLFLYSLILETI